MTQDPQKYWREHNQWFDGLYTKANWFDKLFRKDVYFRMAVANQVCGELDTPTVLDIGCGSGHVACSLLSRAGAAHVTGIDFSGPMLRLAGNLLQEQGLSSRAVLVEGDIFQQDFEKATFDLVIALGVFDYVERAGELWTRMLEWSKHAVVASFPAFQFPRSNLRRVRYGLRGCPVYFYSGHDLARLARQSSNFAVDSLPGQSGHVLVAKKRNGPLINS